MSKEKSNDIDWAALADEFKKNHRPHAGYFSWETDRTLAEWGVLQEFTNALACEYELFFREARHRGKDNDPPDCEGFLADNTHVGIEITELVEGRSIKAARVGKECDWKDRKGNFILEIERLIRRKDKPRTAKGGPYSQYILVIFSDEPWLERDYVERSIVAHSFNSTVLINRAFLILSYDPFMQRFPCYELQLSPNKALQATCEDARA